MQSPKLTVGILSAPKIEFELLGTFLCNGKEVSGKQSVHFEDFHKHPLQSLSRSYFGRAGGQSLIFTPQNEETDAFELIDVTIGINFHWERKENQRFKGGLKIIIEDEKLTAINVISVEDYLVSVISSEMSATSSEELLKAHAVISRSWVLAPTQNTAPHPPKKLPPKSLKGDLWECISENCQDKEVSALSPTSGKSDRVLKVPPRGDLGGHIWYERDAHTHFDVCADDHCQRYQGITRASTEMVKRSVEATRGEVLMYDGTICDARFSKCCGGVMEEFQNCWADVNYPYLKKTRDYKLDTSVPDLTDEAEAEKWIRTSPKAFCNTKDKQILSQVLNNYDQETTDFYRWKVEYSQSELSELILKRSGVDYGEIIDLEPIERGVSGRLIQLKIVGTKQTRIIGKELEIRRTLSESHLYSSAFVVDKTMRNDPEIPEKFTLTGAGWGHGVGLCQIGASVMADEGYSYREILEHYYPGSEIAPNP